MGGGAKIKKTKIYYSKEILNIIELAKQGDRNEKYVSPSRKVFCPLDKKMYLKEKRSIFYRYEKLST